MSRMPLALHVSLDVALELSTTLLPIPLAQLRPGCANLT